MGGKSNRKMAPGSAVTKGSGRSNGYGHGYGQVGYSWQLELVAFPLNSRGKIPARHVAAPNTPVFAPELARKSDENTLQTVALATWLCRPKCLEKN
jgi:hypothetical protein